jgi:hypothetical protein
MPKLLVPHYAPLSALDRCDSCGSRSKVAIMLTGSGSRLDFCGHCCHEHWAALRHQAVIVLDIR